MMRFTCTGGRRGARDPQRRRGLRWHPGERGEVERGQGWWHARRACHRLSQPPFPRPAPQVTSEALPYGILRRMSTDAHGAGPYGCGAVRVGGLVGSALGARQCAEVTRRRLLCCRARDSGPQAYLHPSLNSDKRTILPTFPRLGQRAIHGAPCRLSYRQCSGVCSWRASQVGFSAHRSKECCDAVCRGQALAQRGDGCRRDGAQMDLAYPGQTMPRLAVPSNHGAFDDATTRSTRASGWMSLRSIGWRLTCTRSQGASGHSYSYRSKSVAPIAFISRNQASSSSSSGVGSACALMNAIPPSPRVGVWPHE